MFLNMDKIIDVMDAVLQSSIDSFRQKRRRHKGILDPFQAARCFQLKRYLPSPELAPFIEHHWTIRWDLRGQYPYVFEFMPHSSINFSITLKRAWIIGVTAGVYAYEMRETGSSVGVIFKPGGFYPFWKKNISSITGKEIEADEVFPEADTAFRHSLLGLESDEAMVAGVEKLLLSRNPYVDSSLELITSIFKTIKADKYLRTVEEIAERFAVSERTLQYIFKKYVGIGPKSMLTRNRLMDAAELAAQIEEPDWASVAADLGYSHQSHFVRDFKKTVGRTPEQYVQYIRNK